MVAHRHGVSKERANAQLAAQNALSGASRSQIALSGASRSLMAHSAEHTAAPFVHTCVRLDLAPCSPPSGGETAVELVSGDLGDHNAQVLAPVRLHNDVRADLGVREGARQDEGALSPLELHVINVSVRGGGRRRQRERLQGAAHRARGRGIGAVGNKEKCEQTYYSEQGSAPHTHTSCLAHINRCEQGGGAF